MNVRKLAVVAAGSAIVFSGVGLAYRMGGFPCHATQGRSAAATPPAAEAPVSISTISEVSTLVQSKSAVVLDANGAETRRAYGTLPGAVLLSSYSNYALSELPAAKNEKLVFYCGGTMCRASDAAASRAAAAGYSNVSVMRDGIKGWKDAGQPTEMPKS